MIPRRVHIKGHAINIPDGGIRQMLEDIIVLCEYQEETLEKLRADIKDLKSEHYRDSELAVMKAKLEKANADLYRGFSVTEEEQCRIRDWTEQHINERHSGDDYCGAIGGRYTYEFIPTSIGTIGSIKCVCGEEFTFREI